MTTYRSTLKLESSLSWDEKFHRSYTSKYQVICSYTASPREAANAPGIPAYGSSYVWYSDVDLWAFCKSVEVTPGERIKDPAGSSEDMRVFILTVKHSSIPFEGSNDGETSRENPLDDPIVISGSFSPFKRTVQLDEAGDPILNAAKFPYDPAPQIDDAYDTLRISYNTATINLAQRASFRGCVNSTGIWGLDERQAKITRWDWSILRAGNSLEYVKHTFEFLISYQQHATDPCIGPAGKFGWYTTLPNSGSQYSPAGSLRRSS